MSEYYKFEFFMIIRIAKLKWDNDHNIDLETFYENNREYNSKKLEDVREESLKIYEVLNEYDVKYCTIIDDEYPDEFLELDQPPLIFFYKGNIDILNKEKISFIGSRNVSDAQIEKVNKVSELLNARGNVIVSGLAKGVDFESQINIVNSGNNCIAILPCSFDDITPKSSVPLYNKILENGGLVISEYYPGQITRVYNQYYINRNRLIMALGKNVIVGSISISTKGKGHEAGGTGTALDYAIKMKKNIYFIDDDSYTQSEYMYFKKINAVDLLKGKK